MEENVGGYFGCLRAFSVLFSSMDRTSWNTLCLVLVSNCICHVRFVFPACGKASPVHGAELFHVHSLKLHCKRNDGSESSHDQEGPGKNLGPYF